MGEQSVHLRGVALHSGASVSVTLRRESGPLRIVQRGLSAPLASFAPIRTDRGVCIEARAGTDCIRIDLIEHLLAAFGGLAIDEGVTIETDDGEAPLLDGCAKTYACALTRVGQPGRGSRGLAVARPAELSFGESVYEFEPANETSLRVLVDFPEPIGRQEASWHGEPDDFVRRIAPARTFGWLSDHEALRASGRAAAVDLCAVVVFGPDGQTLGAGFDSPDEAARHKLLDLIGDLTLYGGPPRGAIRAERPGHTATHALVRRALDTGILRRASAEKPA